jgi:hypothetical protein
VLPRPLMVTDIYLAVRRDLPAPLQARIEAMWTAIGRMRELPEFSPAPP